MDPKARLRMGRLDNPDSHDHRYLAWRSDYVGYAFPPCFFSFLHNFSIYLPTRIASYITRATRLTDRLASTVSATGPDAASDLHGEHYVYTPEDVLYTKITFSTTVLYFFIASITKLSILLLFHRIFSISDGMRVMIYIGIAAVVGFWISSTVADLLNCIPLKWTWLNGDADPRYCISYNMFWLGTGIAESVIDLYILVLPLFMVSKLHLERSKKFAVAGIFLLGGL
jgi:hypothetical protein